MAGTSVAVQRLKVFVYGTLKREQPNHYWLADSTHGYSKFLSIGKTVKKFPLVIASRYNVPYLLDKEGSGKNIYGEIYEIDDEMLKNLDILEKYPDNYDREIQEIHTENGNLPCWLYIMRNFPEKLLHKKFLESYSDTDEKPYVRPALRDKLYEKPIDMLNDDL